MNNRMGKSAGGESPPEYILAKGDLTMNVRPVEIKEVKAVLERVGLGAEETKACMFWTHPKLSRPLTKEDRVLAKMTPEEQAFLRCMGYVFEEKEIDPPRLAALHETFWTVIRGIHQLPSSNDVTVKEGKYIVAGEITPCG